MLIAIGIIFAAHVLVEGMRWQMFPGYVLVLMSMLLVFYNINIFKWSLLRKVILSLLFLVMLLVSWILPVVLPVFELPAPMGEYQVGAQQVLVNTGRPELITADAEDQRGFMVKVWYPAVLNGEEQESYLDPGNRLGFSSKYGLPDFETNYLDYVETHTLASAKVAAGKFPVLIFLTWL